MSSLLKDKGFGKSQVNTVIIRVKRAIALARLNGALRLTEGRFHCESVSLSDWRTNKQEVQPACHTMKQEGMILELQIVNYIDLYGEDVRMDSLPDEKRKKIAEQLQDALMLRAGYKRRTA